VLGEWADDESGLIPLSWIREANARWHAWKEPGGKEPGGRRIIGVDVARFGQDHTCLAIRQADIVREVKRYSKLDTTQTTALVEAELLFPKSYAVVDEIGVGAGVVDQLRSHRRRV